MVDGVWDNEDVSSLLAPYPVPAGLFNWRAKRERANHEHYLRGRWDALVERAKRDVARDGVKPISLDWRLSASSNGGYTFSAWIKGGFYNLVIVDGRRVKLSYKSLHSYVTRVIHEDRDPSSCIAAAYRDAARGRFFGQRVKWIADNERRVYAADFPDMRARVRATPWANVYALFLLPAQHAGVPFYFAGDGDLVDLQADAVLASDEDEVSATPARVLSTDRGDATWSYVDKDPDMIARARLGKTRFELGYGEREREYEIRMIHDQYVLVLARGPLKQLLTEPRPLPADGALASSGPIGAALAEMNEGLEAIRQNLEDRKRRLVRGAQAVSEDKPPVGQGPVEAVATQGAAQATSRPAPDWSQHVRELGELIPAEIETGPREAIVWLLGALRQAIGSGDDLGDICGNQRKILSALGHFNEAPAPERHAFGKSLKWLTSVSPLAIRENRQRWLLPLGQLDRLLLDR